MIVQPLEGVFQRWYNHSSAAGGAADAGVLGMATMSLSALLCPCFAYAISLPPHRLTCGERLSTLPGCWLPYACGTPCLITLPAPQPQAALLYILVIHRLRNPGLTHWSSWLGSLGSNKHLYSKGALCFPAWNFRLHLFFPTRNKSPSFQKLNYKLASWVRPWSKWGGSGTKRQGLRIGKSHGWHSQRLDKVTVVMIKCPAEWPLWHLRITTSIGFQTLGV